MSVARPLLAVAAAALLAVGCTTDGDGEVDPTATDTSPTSASTASTDPTPTPTPTATAPTSATPTDGAEEVAFGTGTVTVDGTELAVSGDCDVSRSFGEEPVRGLGDDVDVLLAVDNVTADGASTGPFAIQVRLLGDGAVEGRTVTSEGAPGEDGTTLDVTYEGSVEVAALQDRRRLDFLDVATLHLEATQQRVGGDGGPSRRQLVVDVTCPISRPG